MCICWKTCVLSFPLYINTKSRCIQAYIIGLVHSTLYQLCTRPIVIVSCAWIVLIFESMDPTTVKILINAGLFLSYVYKRILTHMCKTNYLSQHEPPETEPPHWCKQPTSKRKLECLEFLRRRSVHRWLKEGKQTFWSCVIKILLVYDRLVEFLPKLNSTVDQFLVPSHYLLRGAHCKILKHQLMKNLIYYKLMILYFAICACWKILREYKW